MSKLALTDLANLQNENTAVNAINSNNASIITSMDNTLSRDGTSPNEMNATLDMNSNRILNLPEWVQPTEPVTVTQLDALTMPAVVPVTLPVGVSSGGTGYTGGTFSSYNALITSSSGTIASQTSDSQYFQIGKLVFVFIRTSINNAGTATGSTFITLPVNARNAQIIMGRENSLTGISIQGLTNTGSTMQLFTTVNANVAPVTNSNFLFTGIYEAS